MGDHKIRNDRISAKIQERFKTTIKRPVWIHDPAESYKSICSFTKVKKIRVWVLRIKEHLEKPFAPGYHLGKVSNQKERIHK